MSTGTRMRGFSLIELMIAVTLGMLAVAAVGSVFIYGSRNYKQDDKISRMQDELRFAMAQLTQDLEMAGFFAQLRELQRDIDVHSSALDALASADDCGTPPTASQRWALHEFRASIDTIGDATGAQANARFPCIVAADFVPNTDVIAIRRIAGSATKAADIDAKKIYLKTNGIEGAIVKGSAWGTPAPTGGVIESYELRPTVWFIRKFATEAQNPPVPSLCRGELVPISAAAVQMKVACLAQGIEEMQIEFGFDDDANGVADFYREYTGGTSPGIADMERVIAVRVHLLARSSERDVDYKTAKTFNLGPTRTVGPFTDGYYRKPLSSVVLLRNLANRLTPQELPQ